MNLYLFVILLSSFICFKRDDIYSISIKWDEKTAKYLDNGYKNDYSDTGKIKKTYLERCSNFKYLHQKQDTDILRYQFLETIRPIVNAKHVDSFYIVESINSGEQVTIYNYLVLPGKKCYYFTYTGSWVQLDQRHIDPTYIDHVYHSVPQNGDGNNTEDVIITLFKGQEIYSKYFIRGSIVKPQYFLGR